MRLPCDECGTVYDIPDDKWDDYNIYRKWDGKRPLFTCPPHLLCRKCTAKFIKQAKRETQKKIDSGEYVLANLN